MICGGSPIPVATVTNDHKLGGFRKQKGTLPPSGRPEVRDQGVRRASPPPPAGPSSPPPAGPGEGAPATPSPRWPQAVPARDHTAPVSASVAAGPSPLCHLRLCLRLSHGHWPLTQAPLSVTAPQPPLPDIRKDSFLPNKATLRAQGSQQQLTFWRGRGGGHHSSPHAEVGGVGESGTSGSPDVAGPCPTPRADVKRK